MNTNTFGSSRAWGCFLFFLVAVLHCAGLVFGQERYKVTPGYAVEKGEKITTSPSTYYRAYSRAVAEKSPLVVGIEVDPPKGEWLTLRVKYEEPWNSEFYRNSIIICTPSDGTLWIEKILPSNATATDIRRVLRGPEVQRSAPFPERSSVDDEPLATGPWQEVIKGLKWYDKAKYVQVISISDGQDSNELYRLDQDWNLTNSYRPNPNRLFPWAVSGGMENLTGWRSRAAVLIPGKVRVRLERVEAGARRLLPMYRWSFPDGTVFADVLSNGDKVFEVRTRKKVDGEWKSRVAWRDLDAAPQGFHGAGKSCASCHEHAGAQQGYGIRVRGSDETFSWTPFKDGSFVLNRDEWPLE